MITAQGETVRSEVADASDEVERAALRNFATHEVALLRRMLFKIIGQSNDPGFCL